MGKIHSAVKAGDVFAFIDEAKRDSKQIEGLRTRKPLQQLLLDRVVQRVNLVDLPLKRLRDGHTWPINASGLTLAQTTHEIKVRVRLAWFHGIDLSEVFEINEMSIHRTAMHMAELVNSLRSKSLVITSIPGYEKEVQLIGIPRPKVKHLARWFRRALTRHARQLADYFSLLMSEIGRKASPIVSRPVLESRERQIQWQTAFAHSHQLVTTAGNGEQIAVMFSDPKSDAWRRASKNYIRLKGLDAFCEKAGLQGYFVTITLPSQYHPNPANGNRSWDGSTPIDAHKRLQALWRTFQRRFGESGKKVFGVRVEEPHDDACPHWHALIYVEPEREADFHARFQAVFGTGFSTKVVLIDRSLSTGASYLTKYINPRFGKDENESEMVNPKAEKAARYDAYRASWGGRSIQFFDIPGSSSIWDELRRIKSESEQFAQLSKDGQLLRSCARLEPPDYGEFLTLLQKMNADKPRRVHVVYAETESGSRLIQGIFVDGQVIETHQQTWEVRSVIPTSKPAKQRRTVSHSYPSKDRRKKEALGMETGVEMT